MKKTALFTTRLKVTLLLLLLILALLIGSYWQIKKYADTPLAIQQETLFTLAAGTRQIALANQLKQQKIITKSHWYPLLVRLEPALGKPKAGTYRIQPGITLRQLLQLLNSGQEAQFAIRFIEGSRLQEWLIQLEKAPYLRHKVQGMSAQQIAGLLNNKEPLDQAEGWLYPDTYFYTAGTWDEEILQRAYNKMYTALNAIWQERDKSLPYRTPQDLLIMASVIEKETGLDNERGRVASVFINRLRLGMRLQTDPTVIYGMGAAYNGTLTRQDLQAETPYNTYIHTGLPPTAIAMPGRASLLAAAHPEQSDYLYFVADGQGGHVFSTNLQSHNQAVRRYINSIAQNKANKQNRDKETQKHTKEIQKKAKEEK